MSAFMMTPEDFVIIFKGLTEEDILPQDYRLRESVAFSLVKDLELDNAKSIRFRYPHHSHEIDTLTHLPYLSLSEFKENYKELFKLDVDIYKLVKFLHCLRYQSCEPFN